MCVIVERNQGVMRCSSLLLGGASLAKTSQSTNIGIAVSTIDTIEVAARWSRRFLKPIRISSALKHLSLIVTAVAVTIRS